MKYDHKKNATNMGSQKDKIIGNTSIDRIFSEKRAEFLFET